MITQTYSAEYKVCVQINFPMIFMTNKYMTKYIWGVRGENTFELDKLGIYDKRT